MIKLNSFIVQSDTSISDALKIIDSNGSGICFALDGSRLVGVLTDGDIRRGLLKEISLGEPVHKVMNRNFVALPIESDGKTIRSFLSKRIKIIPLCDKQGNLIDIADYTRSRSIPVLEPELSGNELIYLEDCVQSNWISSQGIYVGKFERLFEEMCPGTSGVAVSNGTVALHLALLALDVGPGDEVIVPDLTFAATINAVLYTGATPVLCEVESNTWCIDSSEIRGLISDKTKAILPVHLYGYSCDMEPICNLAEEFKILIIEDCAEAVGSSLNGRSVGTFGNAGTFSFYGNKTITTGEGGMVVFRDPDKAARARILRDHGMTPDRRYWHDIIGYNFRMTNLQAAVGVAQMERLPRIIKKKRQIATWYHERLSGSYHFAHLPSEISNGLNTYWLYTVMLIERFDRDEVIKQMRLSGIETRPTFNSLHMMPLYSQYGLNCRFDNSLKIAGSGLSLPSSITLDEQTVGYICETLCEILDNDQCVKRKS